MIGASVHDDTHYNISVTIEPLVHLLSISDPLASAPDLPDVVENDPYTMDIAVAVDAAMDIVVSLLSYVFAPYVFT